MIALMGNLNTSNNYRKQNGDYWNWKMKERKMSISGQENGSPYTQRRQST